MSIAANDRVRVVKDKNVPEYIGVTGVVTQVDSDDDMWPIHVYFDAPVASRDGVQFDIFNADELEKISTPPAPVEPHVMVRVATLHDLLETVGSKGMPEEVYLELDALVNPRNADGSLYTPNDGPSPYTYLPVAGKA